MTVADMGIHTHTNSYGTHGPECTIDIAVFLSTFRVAPMPLPKLDVAITANTGGNDVAR